MVTHSIICRSDGTITHSVISGQLCQMPLREEGRRCVRPRDRVLGTWMAL